MSKVKINSLKMVTLSLMALLVICVAGRVFAADSGIQVINSGSNGNTNSGSNTNNSISTLNNNNEAGAINTNAGNTNANSLNTNHLNNSNNQSTLPGNTNKAASNSNIPYAGVESNSVIIFLVIATSISAIYTYKKIKDYNM